MHRQLFSRLITGFLFIFPCVCAFSAEENFLLVDNATDEIVLELGPCINERITPCSTFKIVLSLMGYDTGILKDEMTPTWDFQEGYDDYLESWKAPQTPQSWMSRSCIWYSRLLALQLGAEKIQNYLSSFEYGNQDISGGTSAWINSSLKISPKGQVDFIKKIIQEKLPISPKAIKMTKVLLFKEELDGGWKLYGKTGKGSLCEQDGINLEVVWFVGWIEKDEAFFPFAYNFRERIIAPGQSIPRVKQLLTESNVMAEILPDRSQIR